MTRLAEALLERFYGNSEHPYATFEREVRRRLEPWSVLMDVGCGREATLLRKFQGSAARLIGIDLVEFSVEVPGMELVRGDLCKTRLLDESVDLIMARSVMEHVVEPEAAYREIARVLRPGGAFTFLTANLWDYASIAAKVIPNRVHPWIVAKTEGRAEQDVFPTMYKCNTRSSIYKLASEAGLHVDRFQYLSQYPNYFMFNGLLFLIATGYERLTHLPGCSFLRGWILATLTKLTDST